MSTTAPKTKSHPLEDGQTHYSDKHEIDQDNCPKHNPVPAECLEVVAFQVTNQEFDGDDRNEESRQHAGQKHGEFKACKVEAEFDDLQEADPEHDRDAHEEREFRRDEAGSAQNDAPQDGGAGARGARDDRERLEQTDLESLHIGQLAEIGDARFAILVLVFDDDEQNPVDDQRHRHHCRVQQVFVGPVVQWQADGSRRDTSDDYFFPDIPSLRFFFLAFAWGEGIQFVKINDDYGEDGAELNHIEEHFLECLGKVQLDELFNQDHMSGAADWQPFGDTLNDAEDDCFQYFHKFHIISFLLCIFLILHHLV